MTVYTQELVRGSSTQKKRKGCEEWMSECNRRAVWAFKLLLMEARIFGKLAK